MLNHKKHHHHKDKKKGFVAGAVIGSLVAGAAALLFAPKSGKETQTDIKNKAKQVVKGANLKLEEVGSELEGRIDNLKAAAKELHGEAFEESQRLITRAEILRNDLESSLKRLRKNSYDTKEDGAADAKRLVNDGQAVISELEKVTKKIMGSVRNKATKSSTKHDQSEE